MKKIACQWKNRITFCLFLLFIFCMHLAWSNAPTLRIGNAKPSQPDLIRAPGATVDLPFSITFIDDPLWRAAISKILISDNDIVLPRSAYTISAGQISFNPAASSLLQVYMSGGVIIKIIAPGYPIAQIAQGIGFGADNKLAITTQPTAPASNGGKFVVQPLITIQDKYGNKTNSTSTVVAIVGNGAWTLGGTTSLKAVYGRITFSNLTAAGILALNNASIIFTASGLTSDTSNFFTIPPLYDACSGALTIPWLGSVSADNTYDNYKLLNMTPCSTSSDGLTKGAWFKVTPPVSGSMIISTCNVAGVNIYLRVYTGTCSSFTGCPGNGKFSFFCEDNVRSSALIFSATANTTYYILCGLLDNSIKGTVYTLSASPIIMAPSITATAGATADADFTVKFTDNADWRNAITNVVCNLTLLKSGIDYEVTPGLITLKPGATIQSALSKSGSPTLAVLATGYSNASVSLTIAHGIAARVMVSTQPTGPLTSGSVLVNQPAVTVMDQYGNLAGAGVTVNVTVTPGQDDTWSLTGTTSAITNTSSIATFSNLLATSKTGTAFSSASLTFAMGTSLDTSAIFTIPPHLANFPTVTTDSVSSIASTASVGGGNVILDGYATINQRGVVWNTQAVPKVSLVSKTVDGTGTGIFVSSISPLKGNTLYYYRSYATNKVGTSYGMEYNFITLPEPPTALPATDLTSGSFIIRWNDLTLGNALSMTYEIQVGTNATDFSSPTTLINGIIKTANPQQYLINSALVNGTTYYFRIRSVTTAGYSNWSPVSNAVNLPAITLTVSDNQQTIVAGNIARNSSDNIINQVKLVVVNGAATLGSVAFTTPGSDNNCNYTNTDLTNFKLWYNTSNDNTTKIQVGNAISSNKVSQFNPETIQFSSLALILPANTYYFWITCDILKNATAGNTININAPEYTAITGTVSNGCHNSAKQTIVIGSITKLYLKNNLGSPLSVTDPSNWTTLPDGSSGSFLGKMGDNDLTWNIQNVNGIQSANWLLGNHSKVIVGDGVNIINLSIEAGATLLTGDVGIDISDHATLSLFSTSIPVLGSLSAGSTVNFSANSNQFIPAASGAGYFNLTIEGNGCKELLKNTTVNGMLAINASKLSIASNCLTIATKDGQVSGSGFIKSSAFSDLVINSSNPNVGSLNFDQSIDSVTNVMRSVTVNGSGGITTLGNSLHITSGGMLNVTAGTMNLANKHLILDGNTSLGLACIGQVSGSVTGATNVTVNLPIDNWGVLGKWPASASSSSNGTWRNLTLPLSANVGTVYLSTLQSSIQITGPSGVNLDQVGGSNTPGYSCYKYEYGLNSPWTAITNPGGEPLLNNTAAGIGGNQSFWIYIRGPRDSINSLLDAPIPTILSGTGVLQTGDVNYTYNKLTRGQFVLVGNPYASPIDFNSSNLVIKGARKQLWLWDPTVSGFNKTGKYNTLDGLTTTSSEAVNGTKICNILQPGQAFFLRADGTNNGTIQVLFKESCKPVPASFISTLGLPGQGTSYEYLKIGLDCINADGSAMAADGLMALYNNSFSSDLSEEDVIKFPDPVGGISFKRNDTLLGIEGRPSISATDTLFINMAGMVSDATYRFRIAGQHFESLHLSAYLEDKYLKSRQPVSLAEGDTTTIQFIVKNNIEATYSSDRFMITFSMPGVALAINLLSINATQEQNRTIIHWSASGETGILAYEVQCSADGIVFKGIGNVPVNNNSTGTNTYKWIDDNPAIGVNYYRLKMLQLNDNPAYSKVLKITDDRNTRPGIKLYPNPVTNGEIILQLNNLPAAVYSINLYNGSGLRIMKQTFNHIGGSSVVSLPLKAGTAAGMYHITLDSAQSKQYQESLIVQ